MQQWGRKHERREFRFSDPAALLSGKCHVEGPAKTSDEMLAFAGVAAYRSGRFHDAVRMFKEAIGENPKNATAWLYIGMLNREVGDHDKSIRCISESIILRPDDPMAHTERADTYYRKGAIPEARKDALRALELDPDYADAYAILGNCRYAEGKYTEALLALAKYSELAPEDEEGRRRYEEYHRRYMEAARPKKATFLLGMFLPEQLPNGTVMSQFLQLLVGVTYGPKSGADEA